MSFNSNNINPTITINMPFVTFPTLFFCNAYAQVYAEEPAEDEAGTDAQDYTNLKLEWINGWRVSHIQHGSKRESRRAVLAKQLAATCWCSTQVPEGTRHQDPEQYALARASTAARAKRRRLEQKAFDAAAVAASTGD